MKVTDMAEQAELVANILKILAHPKRLLLLCLLVKYEQSEASGKDGLNVSTLTEETGMSQSQTSQYLKSMQESSIVTSKRLGKEVFYRIGDPKVLDIIRLLYHLYCPNPLKEESL